MSNYINTMFPQASISTRSDTAVSKPAVFHSENKRKMQLEIQMHYKQRQYLQKSEWKIMVTGYQQQQEPGRKC